MGGTRFHLNKVDWKKIGTGFLIAMSGPFVLWLGDATGQIDVGLLTPTIAALIATLVNVIRKWAADNSGR